jgi:hypothetical protein
MLGRSGEDLPGAELSTLKEFVRSWNADDLQKQHQKGNCEFRAKRSRLTSHNVARKEIEVNVRNGAGRRGLYRQLPPLCRAYVPGAIRCHEKGNRDRMAEGLSD